MLHHNNRVNIINFIRGVEPRMPMDLFEAVREEIALVNHYRLPATWLLQYDALINDDFVLLLKENLDDTHEFGAWFEVVQPLVERAGIVWRGRYPWDWHAHVGFSVGYTPAEREKLADIFMAEFHQQFGYYPKSVGSWFMDAHLLGYLSDHYDIVASCNCKDQWGTDGYTLWGGYYNQAYYPSRSNGFMPAQHASHQIPVPVFRMLGSDPIYQYDAADHGHGQSVITLEPVYTGEDGGGGVPSWVRWFFDVNFQPPQLSFGYTQVGQENSFGWDRMKEGLTDQIAYLAEQQQNSVVKVETLAESGKWYKETYPVTPVSSILALTDWRASGKQSLWYYSRFYRMNALLDGSRFVVRDIHLFNEQYEERYLRDICETELCCYDTLPVMDGGRWGGGVAHPGIVPLLVNAAGELEVPAVTELEIMQADEEQLSFSLHFDDGEKMTVRCTEQTLEVRSTADRWGLEMKWGEADTRIEVLPNAIAYEHNDFHYQVQIEGCELGMEPQAASENIGGQESQASQMIHMKAQEDTITFRF